MITTLNIDEIYILSAYKDDLQADANEVRHAILKEQLRLHVGERFGECNGRFKGKKEKSLVVLAKRMVIHHYASMYKQSSFLRLENHKHIVRRAYLIDVESGSEEFLGYFRTFTKHDVEVLGLDYTEKEGQYFSIWPTDHTDQIFDNEIANAIQSKIEQERVYDIR